MALTMFSVYSIWYNLDGINTQILQQMSLAHLFYGQICTIICGLEMWYI